MSQSLLRLLSSIARKQTRLSRLLPPQREVSSRKFPLKEFARTSQSGGFFVAKRTNMAIAERIAERPTPKSHIISRLEPTVHLRGERIGLLDRQLHGLRVLFQNDLIDKQTYKIQKTPLLVERRGLSWQQGYDRITLRKAKRAKEEKKSLYR